MGFGDNFPPKPPETLPGMEEYDFGPPQPLEHLRPEISGNYMNDEELRETSVDIAANLLGPATTVQMVTTGKLFSFADAIGHYIRTGEHEAPDGG